MRRKSDGDKAAQKKAEEEFMYNKAHDGWIVDIKEEENENEHENKAALGSDSDLSDDAGIDEGPKRNKPVIDKTHFSLETMRGWKVRLAQFVSSSTQQLHHQQQQQPNHDQRICVWAMFPTNQLLPLRVESYQLNYMFHNEDLWLDADQPREYKVGQLPHYMDEEFVILQKFTRRVFMVHSYHNSRLPNNATACRILMDLMHYDPPNCSADDLYSRPFDHLPRGPVFFIQTVKDQLISYELQQLRRDWPDFFRENMPYLRLITDKQFRTWDEPLRWMFTILMDGSANPDKRDEVKQHLKMFVSTYLQTEYEVSLSQLNRIFCTLVAAALKLIQDNNRSVIPWKLLSAFPALYVFPQD